MSAEGNVSDTMSRAQALFDPEQTHTLAGRFQHTPAESVSCLFLVFCSLSLALILLVEKPQISSQRMLTRTIRLLPPPKLAQEIKFGHNDTNGNEKHDHRIPELSPLLDGGSAHQLSPTAPGAHVTRRFSQVSPNKTRRMTKDAPNSEKGEILMGKDLATTSAHGSRAIQSI